MLSQLYAQLVASDENALRKAGSLYGIPRLELPANVEVGREADAILVVEEDHKVEVVGTTAIVAVTELKCDTVT